MVEIEQKPYSRSDFISLGKIITKHNFNGDELNRLLDIKKSVEENYTQFLKTRKPIARKTYKDSKTNYYKQKSSNKYYKKKRGGDFYKETGKKSTFKVENWRSYKENKPKRDEKSIEVIRKRINMELNKLSGDNLNAIYNCILEILDGQDDLLNIMVEDLFKKAVQQKTFCKYYATLAYNINNDGVFKDMLGPILLDYCRKLYYENANLVVIDKTSDYDAFCKYLNEKKRFIGNFQFMGELYKQSLVELSIIENFWTFLLKDIQKQGELIESYSECICQLLNTIGNKLEKQYTTETEFYNKWMVPIKEFSENREMFKPRMRFLFMDCLERKKWT